MNIILTTIFTIMMFGTEDNKTYFYYVKNRNIHAALNTEKPIGSVGDRIKLTVEMECERSIDPSTKQDHFFCNISKWEKVK